MPPHDLRSLQALAAAGGVAGRLVRGAGMSDADVLQDDLRDMLLALGLSDHARPQSPHEVFRDCIEEVKRSRAEMLSALIGITNCADGLSFRAGEIQAVVGLTNWSVLRHWIDEARAVIARVRATGAE